MEIAENFAGRLKKAKKVTFEANSLKLVRGLVLWFTTKKKKKKIELKSPLPPFFLHRPR
jgi:hypothetical protein